MQPCKLVHYSQLTVKGGWRPYIQLSARSLYRNKSIELQRIKCYYADVQILKTNKKKVVELAYSDDDDLEALLKSICGGDFFADND